jgi:hypothetical protein
MRGTSKGERVVIRMAPTVLLARTAPALLGFVAASAFLGKPAGAPVFIVVFAAMYLVTYQFARLVLTPQALEIWSLGFQQVHWSNLGAVQEFRYAGQRYLRAVDSTTGRSHKLPAPLALRRLGRGRMERDRQVIEEWLARYRDQPAGPPTPSGHDPYAPPE